MNAYSMKSKDTAHQDIYKAVVGIPNCSATFIHPRVILTAAHCLKSLGPSAEVFPKRRSQSNSYAIFKQPKAHPQFSPTKKYINYDVAAIVLKDAVTDKEILDNIPALDFEGVEYKTATAVGMGYDRTFFGTNDIFPDMTKKKTEVKIDQIVGDMFLTKVVVKKNGACTGDSGGALLATGADGKPVYIGTTVAIDAAGICSKDDGFIYFERFSSIASWVEEETGIKLR